MLGIFAQNLGIFHFFRKNLVIKSGGLCPIFGILTQNHLATLSTCQNFEHRGKTKQNMNSERERNVKIKCIFTPNLAKIRLFRTIIRISE